jgi:thymidylate synthase ThyX
VHEDEKAALAAFVSNLDRPVYAIYGLPEEVIAVIFAYVSRSPLSFRENLLRLLREERLGARELAATVAPLTAASETARRFHERWVVGYGHASVAEHAVVHLGVEEISRLASAELELASSFLSFTEYSQRYQRPAAGSYVVPPELPPEWLAAYRAFQDESFAAYERLLAALVAYHRARGPAAGESEARFLARTEKEAFEDARYALTLAVRTSLGLTANGRALRDAVVVLLGSPYAEVRRLAKDLAAEGGRVLPTLLRHLDPRPDEPRLRRRAEAGAVRLLEYTGMAGPEPLAAALTAIGVDPPTLEGIERAFPPVGRHGLPAFALDQVRYRFALTLSEAAWHQLLRHNRRTDFRWSPPSAETEPIVPPAVRAAGAEAPLRTLAERARALFRELAAAAPAAASYVVLNAHRREVEAALSLRELVHLVRLRGAANAQWEIRQTVAAMAAAVEAVHPGLLQRLVGVEATP